MGRSPLLTWEQGGELAGRTGSSAIRQGRGADGREPSSLPVRPRLSISVLHSAVASQLVPRGTWRHLVSASTGAGTAEGCGRFSSTPVGPDARLQSVTGGATPEWEEPDAKSRCKRLAYTYIHAPLLGSLTFLTSGCYAVIYGSGFTGRRVQVLALRRLAGVLGRGELALVPLDWPRPARRVHAAPRAAAELQPPHVAHHGGGVESLLMREKQ